MLDDQILDKPIYGDEASQQDVMDQLAGGGKRFANYLIDTFIYYIILVVFFVILSTSSSFDLNSSGMAINLLSIVGYILYYWLLETLTGGKTVGKYITRTRAVKEDGGIPESINFLGRALCRCIPFEVFSFLGTPGRGWHDSIPEIYVIEE